MLNSSGAQHYQHRSRLIHSSRSDSHQSQSSCATRTVRRGQGLQAELHRRPTTTRYAEQQNGRTTYDELANAVKSGPTVAPTAHRIPSVLVLIRSDHFRRPTGDAPTRDPQRSERGLRQPSSASRSAVLLTAPSTDAPGSLRPRRRGHEPSGGGAGESVGVRPGAAILPASISSASIVAASRRPGVSTPDPAAWEIGSPPRPRRIQAHRQRSRRLQAARSCRPSSCSSRR